MSDQNNTDILMIKLVTGEEIIAKTQDLGNAFVVENPMQLIMVPDAKGNMSVGAQTYAPYVSGAMIVSKAAVVFFGNPDQKLLNSYQEQNGMIVTPPTPSILV